MVRVVQVEVRLCRSATTQVWYDGEYCHRLYHTVGDQKDTKILSQSSTIMQSYMFGFSQALSFEVEGSAFREASLLLLDVRRFFGTA